MLVFVRFCVCELWSTAKRVEGGQGALAVACLVGYLCKFFWLVKLMGDVVSRYALWNDVKLSVIG